MLSFMSFLRKKLTPQEEAASISKGWSHVLQVWEDSGEREKRLKKLYADHPDYTRIQKDQAGDTPLHYVVKYRNADSVLLLLEHGADLSMEDKEGDTPLHSAARCGYVDIVSLFLGRGAAWNTKNNAGDTPLHSAASGGRPDTVLLLLEHGADLSIKNNAGDTPLHSVASYGYVDIMSLLLGRGAAWNTKNNAGDTPLHSAASGENADAMLLLLELGADLSIKNNAGKTAFSLLRRQRSSSYEEFFVKYFRALPASPAAEETKEEEQPSLSALYARHQDDLRPAEALFIRISELPTLHLSLPLFTTRTSREMPLRRVIEQRLEAYRLYQKSYQAFCGEAGIVYRADRLPALPENTDLGGVFQLQRLPKQACVLYKLDHFPLEEEARAIELLDEAVQDLFKERAAGQVHLPHDSPKLDPSSFPKDLIDLISQHHCAPIHDARKPKKEAAESKDAAPEIPSCLTPDYVQRIKIFARLAVMRDDFEFEGRGWRRVDEHYRRVRAYFNDVGPHESPFLWAVSQNNAPMVEMLLDMGEDIEERGRALLTPLELARERDGLVTLGDFLLKRKAPRTHNNFTALHFAVKNNYSFLVKMLLEKGANIEAKDVEGKTALHLAAQNGDMHMVQILLNNKANTKASDREGWTPFHCAVQFKHEQVANILLGRNTMHPAEDRVSFWEALTQMAESDPILSGILKEHPWREEYEKGPTESDPNAYAARSLDEDSPGLDALARALQEGQQALLVERHQAKPESDPLAEEKGVESESPPLSPSAAQAGFSASACRDGFLKVVERQAEEARAQNAGAADLSSPRQ
jgi:ankyrin repeat protein